jgi:PAS domain S-box-containing protein
MLGVMSDARSGQAEATNGGGRHLRSAGAEASTASGSFAIAEAAALGLPALAGVVAGAQDGITVVDAERRVVYANPAACEMLGYSLEELRGRDFLGSIAARERSSILARFSEQLSGSVAGAPAPFTCNLLDPDGSEREIVYSRFVVDVAGSPHLVAIFQDLRGSRAAGRAAAALAQTAAQLVKAGLTTDEILAGIGRHAVEETRAVACRISVVDEDHRLASAGGYGPGYGLRPDGEDTRSPLWIALADQRAEDVIAAITGGSIVIGEVPGKPVVVLDAPSVWEADPIIGDFAASLKGLDWHAGVYVPLSWENRVFGLFAVYLPTGVPGPSEAELAFYTALANQAAVVVVNARLNHQVRKAATASERARLARELHDSVSQGLFSMTMHARAAQLAMAQTSLDANGALGRSIAELSDLTRGALAEMRALIFELRPAAVAEEGLVAALRKQAAALSARNQAVITMDGPEERLDLDAEVEEHLYRIASEALHNVVRHSGAAGATVSVNTEAGTLRLEVSDDGAGFDQAGEHPGHLGLSTMAERAATIGAGLAVTSAPGKGTTVAVSLPEDRGDQRRATPVSRYQAATGNVHGRNLEPSATARSAVCGGRGQPAPGGTTDVQGCGSSAVADAAALGLSPLAGILSGAQEGITVCDAERRFVYANPAACHMLGRPLEQLRGEDFLSIIPPQEHTFALGRFSERLGRSVGDAAAPFSAMLFDSEGAEREIVCSTFATDIAGSQHGVTIFRDVTGSRAAARAAAALAQAASQLVGAGTTIGEVLAGIARHAVEGTRAVACGFEAMGVAEGGYGPDGPTHGEKRGAGWIALADIPVTDRIEAFTAGAIGIGELAGKPVVLPDARSVWEANPILEDFVLTMGDWRGAAVFVPLAWESRVFGWVAVFLPSGVAGPSEEELAFYTALADQAAVAVTNARLASEARQAAALLERGRLARELHDSVSQALFSMTMHARAAQLAMAQTGLDEGGPLGRAIAELGELTRGAMAEMRALIFELRPGALAEEGLVVALRKQAAALTAREETVITVEGAEERLDLDAEVEEHLYRIVYEALHNVVSHAGASRATVSVTDAAGSLRVAVRDDGAGFDPDAEYPGHLGLSTMAERAATIGAELGFHSTPGMGTTVVISVAHDRRDQEAVARDAG